MSTGIAFIKVNGCGNDFVLIDRSAMSPKADQQLVSSLSDGLAEQICDRRRGVGADGILLLSSKGDHWVARIINADGSDGGMCGNGLRCIALYLQQTNLSNSARSIQVEMGGRTTCLAIGSMNPFRCALDLGIVRVGRTTEDRSVPNESLTALIARLGATHVGVGWAGNPHAAVMLPEVSGSQLAAISQTIRTTGLFPDGVNVTIASQSGPGHLIAMTDERGVGPTQACASGAAALVAIMHRAGLVDTNCEVEMPGGSLSVELTPDPQDPSDFRARIAGTAEITFQGEIPLSAPKSTV